MARHILITGTIRRQLLANGEKSELDGGGDHVPVCKLFTPAANCTWLVTEMDPQCPDRAFGLADLGLGTPELGWFSLAEISQPVGWPMKLPLERDMLWDPKGIPLSAWADAARNVGMIDDNPEQVRRFVQPAGGLFPCT